MNKTVSKILAPLRELLKKMSEKHLLLLLSFIVGICSGLAAVVLEKSIILINHALTSWFSSSSDNYFYLLYPGIGMLLAMLFVHYVLKDNISQIGRAHV